jgi:hypothetical protein
MKVVVRKGLKLDLPYALGMVYAWPGVSSPTLLTEMQRAFGCKRRAAQDALSILVAGGWLERRNDETDARRKTYFVTNKGTRDLGEWSGWRKMRLSRWSLSTTSTRARRRRQSAHGR